MDAGDVYMLKWEGTDFGPSRVERYAARYDESKHPRESDGKFAEKGGGSKGSGSPTATKKPTNPGKGRASKNDPVADAYESVLSSRVPAGQKAPGSTPAPKNPSATQQAKPKPHQPSQAKPKGKAKPTIEAKPEEFEGTLDALQTAISGVGLIPGWGEAADLANAAIYLARGQYTMAGLSLVSMVPVIGDAIGKGGQALIVSGKYGGKTLARIAPLVEKHWPKLRDALGKAKDLKKYAGPIDKALNAAIALQRQKHATEAAAQAKPQPKASSTGAKPKQDSNKVTPAVAKPQTRSGSKEKYSLAGSTDATRVLYRAPKTSEGQRGMFGADTTSRQPGLRWVTIGAQESGDGERRGGIPVQIDGEGNIVGGRRAESLGLHDKHVSDVKDHFDERRAMRDEAKGGDVPDFDFGFDEPAGGPQDARYRKTPEESTESARTPESERQEAERRLPGPKTQLRRDLAAAAGSDPRRQAAFLDLLHETVSVRADQAREYNDALDTLLSHYIGEDTNDRLRLIGQLRKRSDPSRVEGFDLILDGARRDFPWLLYDRNEPTEEAALAEKIKRGRLRVPSISDSEVWTEAAERFYGGEIPDDPDAYWSEFETVPAGADEWDAVPFSLRGHGERVTRYSLRESNDRSQLAAQFAIRHNNSPGARKARSGEKPRFMSYDDAARHVPLLDFVRRYGMLAENADDRPEEEVA